MLLMSARELIRYVRLRVLRFRKSILLALMAFCLACIFIQFGFRLFSLRNYVGKCPTADEISRTEETDDEVILRRFRQRQAHLNSVCDEKRHKTAVEQCVLNVSKWNFHYIPSEQIVVCTVQKTGSSFLKSILRRVGQNIEFSEENSWGKVRGILGRPVTIMQTRNPFTKLYSAWSDKLYDVSPTYWREVGMRVVEAVRENATEHQRKCGHDVTFLEFLTYVVRNLKATACFERHFTPVYNHCLPCNVKYEYIVHYETYKEDIMLLIKHLKLKEKVKIADFDNFSVEDAISGAFKLFRLKKGILQCMSFQCALFRVWTRLQSRGVIDMNAEFPYASVKKAENLTLEDFARTLRSVSSSSLDAPEQGARSLAVSEAYSTVPREVIELIQDVYQLDFDMFGYDKNMSFIPEYSTTPHHKILRKCPF